MLNSSNVNSNIYPSPSRQAPSKVANNFARKGRSVSLNLGEIKEDKRAQNNKGAQRARSMQKLPLCLVPRKDISEPVQRTKVFFKNEEQENSAKFKAWTQRYAGWFEDIPEVREAFLKYAPQIIEALPDLNLKTLVILTYQAGPSAPQRLKTLLEHAPTIQKVLPHFTGATLLPSSNGIPTAGEAFIKWGAKIKKLLPTVKDEWLIAVAIQKKGYKKLQLLFKYLSKNKKQFPHFSTTQLIQMATFQESGIVGLNLLKKLEMSTFEGINILLLTMIRELTTFPDDDFFLCLRSFRWHRLRKFGQAVADDEKRLLEEYMPPEGMDSKDFTLADPSYSLSRRAWTRLIQLYAWGPATGLTIDIRRELFNHYLGRAHSPRDIHKHRCLLPPFKNSPAPQCRFPEMPAPNGGLIDELDDGRTFIGASLRQGLRRVVRPLQSFVNRLYHRP